MAGQRRFEISWVEGAVKPGEKADQAEVEAAGDMRGQSPAELR